MRLKTWFAVLGAMLVLVPAGRAQLYRALTVTSTVELASSQAGYWDVVCPSGTYAVGGGASTVRRPWRCWRTRAPPERDPVVAGS